MTDLPTILLLDDSSAEYWTRQRKELARWFEERASSFTTGYKAAVRLLHTPGFPARVHLVCHVVRDIYRFLPAALGLKSTARASEVFPELVKDLAVAWNQFPPPPSLTPQPVGANVAVSPQVYERLVTLINKSAEKEGQPSIGQQLAISLFRSLDRHEDEYIHPCIIKCFNDEYNFFVKRAHLVISADRLPSDDQLVTQFEAFERAFHSLVGPYFSGKEELDAILQDTNATTD